MAAGASTLERLIGLLIPPASREEVLGDLRERRGSRIAGESCSPEKCFNSVL